MRASPQRRVRFENCGRATASAARRSQQCTAATHELYLATVVRHEHDSLKISASALNLRFRDGHIALPSRAAPKNSSRSPDTSTNYESRTLESETLETKCAKSFAPASPSIFAEAEIRTPISLNNVPHSLDMGLLSSWLPGLMRLPHDFADSIRRSASKSDSEIQFDETRIQTSKQIHWEASPCLSRSSVFVHYFLLATVISLGSSLSGHGRGSDRHPGKSDSPAVATSSSIQPLGPVQNLPENPKPHRVIDRSSWPSWGHWVRFDTSLHHPETRAGKRKCRRERPG